MSKNNLNPIWLLLLLAWITGDCVKSTCGNKNPWIKSIVWFLVIIVAVCLGSAVVNTWYPKIKTNRILQVNIYPAREHDWQTCTNLIDGWGNPIIYQRLIGEKSTIYAMTSFGRDGLAGTKDDIVVSLVDLNKSRIVGEWIGKKSHEAAIGVIEGWKEKSKFKGTNE